MKAISIIIPTYNEASNIARLIPRIFFVLPGVELIVVDDSSPDSTAEIVKKLAAVYPVKLIVRPKRAGLASAVIEGARQAASNIVGVMDGDLSHPADLLPVMAERMKKADIVIASRYVRGGQIIGWPAHRRIISKAATALARAVLRIRTKDPMSGFFFIRKDILLATPLKATGFKLLLNILAANRGVKVEEIPYTFRERQTGQSKMGRGEIFNYLITICRLLRL